MVQESIMASQTFWLVIGLILHLVPIISSARQHVEKSGVHMREKRFLRVVEDDGTLPEDVDEDSDGDDVQNSDFTPNMGDDEDNEEEEEEGGGNSSMMGRLRLTSPVNGHGGALVDQAISNDINPDSEIAHLLEGMWVEHNGKEVHPNVDVSKSDKNLGNLHDSHVLTHHQKVQYGLESEFLDEQKKKRRKKRNFHLGNDYLWTQGIVPYTIADSLSSGSAQMIETAIAMMSNLTCVRFTPRFSSLATTTVGNDNYVVFQNGGYCASYVGRIGGSQSITLYEPYCITIDTIIHEMCHALGQEHEQSRTDRDNYVELLWNNIQDGQSNVNMRKESTRDNHPYDLESVLQYSLGAFAIDNSRPTIRVLDPKLAFLADAATGLMYYDVRDITTVYQCTSSCSNSPNCQNGGFLNHRCQCYCPSGLTGSDCSQIQTDNNCGGIIDLASGETRTITSPNYPSNYDVNAVCNWLIRAPTGMKVQMDIDDMELSDNGQACYHWLEVRYNLMGQRGPELCGTRRGEVYTTTNDELPSHMMLKFNSIFASDRPAQKGFSLTVKPVGKGCSVGPCVLGTCTDLADGAYSCACPTGISGTNCDTVSDPSLVVTSNFDGSEKDFLANENGDSFDWTLRSGETPSQGTGPSQAHSGSFYIYTEMSSPRTGGDIARLSTSINFPDVDYCLEFYYHMYGGSLVGTLNVYTQGTSQNIMAAWTISGNQGDSWQKAEVSIQKTSGLKVIFEAVRLNSWQSDIAIDSVKLTPGLCVSQSSQSPTTQVITTTKVQTTTQLPTNAPTTTQAPTNAPTTTQAPTNAPTTTQAPTNAPTTTQAPTVAPTTTQSPTYAPTMPQTSTSGPVSQVSCMFEDGEACFLTNMASNGTRQAALLTGDTFDWTMNHQGRTPSSRTGPNFASQGNKFAFIEASRPQRRNDRAVLQSSEAFDDNTWHCLTFDYHMYGSRVGKLNVYTTSSGGVTAKIFKDNGNHGNVWMNAALEIPPVQGLQIYVEAIRGRSWRGDIALDNVIIKTGPCGCLSSPCQNGGSCTSASNTNGFTCACATGYSGETCSTVVGSVNCTFTSGESCFLWQSNNDDYNWSFGTRTPSPRTGPQSTIDGTFAYTEASRRRRGGRYVFTTDGTPLGNQDWCLSFDYYMYGSKMGDLVIHSGVSGSTSEQWRMTGNQGMQWQRAYISIPAAQNLVVKIEGIRGRGFTGDIAIDNVKLDPGTCSLNVS